MFTFPNMVHLLSNELSGLSGGRFGLTFIALYAFDGFLFRHKISARVGLRTLDGPEQLFVTSVLASVS
jgi:hypothetical protein